MEPEIKDAVRVTPTSFWWNMQNRHCSTNVATSCTFSSLLGKTMPVCF